MMRSRRQCVYGNLHFAERHDASTADTLSLRLSASRGAASSSGDSANASSGVIATRAANVIAATPARTFFRTRMLLTLPMFIAFAQASFLWYEATLAWSRKSPKDRFTKPLACGKGQSKPTLLELSQSPRLKAPASQLGPLFCLPGRPPHRHAPASRIRL